MNTIMHSAPVEDNRHGTLAVPSGQLADALRGRMVYELWTRSGKPLAGAYGSALVGAARSVLSGASAEQEATALSALRSVLPPGRDGELAGDYAARLHAAGAEALRGEDLR